MTEPRQAFSEDISAAIRFRVVFEPEPEGGFVVTCPALPGCVSEGETLEEAQANIQEAIVGYMESLRKHGEAIPVD